MFPCQVCLAHIQEIERLRYQIMIMEADAMAWWNHLSKSDKTAWDWATFGCFYCHQQAWILKFIYEVSIWINSLLEIIQNPFRDIKSALALNCEIDENEFLERLRVILIY